MELLVFSSAVVAGLYLFNSGLARRFVKIDIREALCYVSAVMFLGVFSEVAIDSLYSKLFGAPLWLYRVLPIHHAYTSYYSLFIWGAYGFHLYLLHRSFGRRIRSVTVQSIVVSLEAIILEIVLNLAYLVLFGQYVFYYIPNDLWHITSLQALPLYFMAGFLIVRLTKDEKVDPWFFIAANLTLASVLVFLLS